MKTTSNSYIFLNFKAVHHHSSVACSLNLCHSLMTFGLSSGDVHLFDDFSELRGILFVKLPTPFQNVWSTHSLGLQAVCGEHLRNTFSTLFLESLAIVTCPTTSRQSHKAPKKSDRSQLVMIIRSLARKVIFNGSHLQFESFSPKTWYVSVSYMLRINYSLTYQVAAQLSRFYMKRVHSKITWPCLIHHRVNIISNWTVLFAQKRVPTVCARILPNEPKHENPARCLMFSFSFARALRGLTLRVSLPILLRPQKSSFCVDGVSQSSELAKHSDSIFKSTGCLCGWRS